MFLKYVEALWIAITFAEAGEHDYAQTEMMKIDGQEFEYPVSQPVSETL